MHGGGIGPGVDDDAALRLAAGDVEKTVAQAFMKLVRHPLEPCGGIGTAGGARQPLGNGKIEDQREVRRKSTAMSRYSSISRSRARPRPQP